MADFLIDSRYTWYTPINFASVNTQNNTNTNNNNNTNTNNNNTNTNNNNNNNNNVANPNDVIAPDAEDYTSQFNTKLGLIKKYCDEFIVTDENGDEIDVNKIRSEYSDCPKEGVEYCDSLIKNFDKDKVEKIIKAQYKQRVEANTENGKQIADNWVKTLVESDTETPQINTSNVNADNILDVIGGFVTNEKVQDGTVSLSQLFKNQKTAETLVTAIKTKAQNFIKRKDLDEDTKNTITTKTNALINAKYDYVNSDAENIKSNRDNLATKYMELFEALRTEQAKLNDAAAPQYYGLPNDFQITLTNESDRASEEIQAYKNRKQFSANA